MQDLEHRNAALQAQLNKANPLSASAPSVQQASTSAGLPDLPNPACTAEHGLTKAQVERYSRQMILPSFGSQGEWVLDSSSGPKIHHRNLFFPALASSPDSELAAQGRLCRSSVLVVGAGGLGSPAVLYLAAAGVGRLGIVDKDTVELSNLHRQIAHTEAGQGVHKAESAADACRALNSSIEVRWLCDAVCHATLHHRVHAGMGKPSTCVPSACHSSKVYPPWCASTSAWALLPLPAHG